MRYILLVLLLTASIVHSSSQIARIEQLYAFEHSEPTSILEHDNQYFCTYLNGQVAVFDAKNLQPRLVQIPVGIYVTDVYSADGLLWIHSSTGHLFYSASSGLAWDDYGCETFAVFKPHGAGLYFAVGDTIRRISRQGQSVSDSVYRVIQDSRTLESFAIRNDTAVVIFRLSDSMSVIASDLIWVLPLDYARVAHFYQLNDESIVYVTLGQRLYFQSSSLRLSFLNYTSTLSMNFVAAIVPGNYNNDFTLVASGFNSVPFKHLVSKIGSDRVGGVVLESSGSYGRLRAATVHDDSVIVLTAYGKAVLQTGTSLDSSTSNYPDVFDRGGFGYSFLDNKDVVTRSLPRSVASGYRSILYSDFKVNELFESESRVLRDSLGAAQSLIGNDLTGIVASTSKSIAFAPSVAGPWSIALPINGGQLFRLRDGGLVSTILGNGVGLSNDNGKTWSVHYIKSMFNGFVQAVSDGNFIALNRGLELYILPRALAGDTVVPFTYTPTHGGSITILDLKGDTAYLLHPRYTSKLSRELDRLVLLRVSRKGVLDSTVISLPEPLPGFSRVSAALFNDTVVVYESISARYLMIMNGELIYDSVLPQSMREPFASAAQLNMTATIMNSKHVRVISPDYGFAADIYPFGVDSTVGVVDQYISHFYISVVRPNPAAGSINVDIGKFVTADVKGVTLHLCALDGKIERDFTEQLPVFGSGNEVKTVTLNIGDVACGAYLLVIRSSKNVHSYKVMVVR